MIHDQSDTANTGNLKFTLSIAEACAASGFSRSFLYNQMKAGRLPFRKMGKRRYVIADQFKDWLTKGEDSHAV